MRKPILMLSAVSLIVLLGLLGVAVSSMGAVSAGQTKPEAPPPLLAPPDTTGYEQLSSGAAPITAKDNRRIAQFRQTPAEYAGPVEVYLPQISGWEDKTVEAYAVLASVRYSGSGHTVLVTTAQPSPGAMRREVVLGDQMIQLAGSTKAWLSTDMGGEFPNRILFSQDGLLVTVASDLPPATLQELAALVELK